VSKLANVSSSVNQLIVK